MYYAISYDVSDDKKRSFIAKLLKNTGYHLQKSVFIVNMDSHDKAMLLYQQICTAINTKTDSIYLTPICSSCLKRNAISSPLLDFRNNVWMV